MKEKIRFIINPIAGTSAKKELPELIRKNLDPGKYEMEILFTEYAGHATELTKDGIKEGIRYFVATGGDGSVKEIATALVHQNAVLGIIPRGSGNGLARNLGIPLDTAEAVKTINRPHIMTIDSCKAGEEYFFNIAGVGFDGLIAHRFAGSRHRGFRTYVSTIIRHLLTYRPRKITCTIAGESPVTSKPFLVAFANSKQYGNNFLIAPDAEINDGYLDICQVNSMFELLGIRSILDYLSGKIYRNRYVTSRKAANITIESKQPLLMHLDGEPISPGHSITLEMVPASLQVMVPKTESQ